MKAQQLAEQSYPKAELENSFLQAPLSSQQSVQVRGRFHFFDHRCSPDKTNYKLKGLQAGQIVVEYVLMLLVAVTIAILIIKTVVSREPGNEGFLIKAWGQIITTISSDKTDEVSPQQPGQAP